MKYRYVLIGILLLMLCAIFWWLSRSQEDERLTLTKAVSTSEKKANISSINAVKDLNTKPQAQSKSSNLNPAPAVSEAVRQYVENVRSDPQYDWKQPINFYGRVVNESNQPLADANAHFKWTDLSENGTSDADSTSDVDGLFSLRDRTGKIVSVTVSKNGYYTPHSEMLRSFEYANPADGLFVPDSNNPIIFHLRKKGIGVALLTSQHGITPSLSIHISRDGTPVKLDFLHQKLGENGQIQFSEIKPEYKDWKQAASWSFRMEIPDGGFVEQNDEFPFEAPESGYQPVLSFQFQKGGTNWTDGLNKNYYIRFGSPSVYGTLHIVTGISNGGAILTYAINPTGSRNLEPAN